MTQVPCHVIATHLYCMGAHGPRGGIMESQEEEVAVVRKPRTDRVQAVLALSGIVGPVLFTIVVVILAALRTDYSHLHNTISWLYAVGAPNAAFGTAAAVVLGALLVAFAVGLHRGIGEGKGSRIGPALLALGGVGFVVLGFPADFEDPQSFTGLMHGIGGFIAFALIVAPFFLSRRLRRVDAWRDLSSYSLVTGVVAVPVFVVSLILIGVEDSSIHRRGAATLLRSPAPVGCHPGRSVAPAESFARPLTEHVMARVRENLPTDNDPA